MAGNQLIDGYLTELRRRLAWSPDVDDTMAEVEDHLLCAVEQLVTDGVPGVDAQQYVLDRFGHATSIAAAHAATSRGGIAMPTRFTRLAGIAAIVAAALWSVSASAWLVDFFIDPEGPAGTAVELLAFAALGCAVLGTMVFVIGLNQRHGGLGPLGVIGVVLIGLACLATTLFWFVMGWGVLLAAGMLLVAVAVRARGLAPGRATIAFGSAWAVGVTVWSILRLLEVGTRDRWGDYPIVSPLAIAVGVAILVPGLIGLGRWLSTETPQDVDSSQPLAAT